MDAITGLKFTFDFGNRDEFHCVKGVQIRSFSWSVFCRIRTRKNSVFGQFSGNVRLISCFHSNDI